MYVEDVCILSRYSSFRHIVL